MKKRVRWITLLGALPLSVCAEAPWGKVDLEQGKRLHQAQCVACHAKMYGGDGSRMYTRAGRQLSDKLELLQRTASCNATMNTGWFPEEEAHVAAWLNKEYYHFER